MIAQVAIENAKLTDASAIQQIQNAFNLSIATLISIVTLYLKNVFKFILMARNAFQVKSVERTHYVNLTAKHLKAEYVSRCSQ